MSEPEGPTVTPRRAGEWVWQNWRWSDGSGFYATETENADGGFTRWVCEKEDDCWILAAEGFSHTAICPTLTEASAFVLLANGAPQ